MSMHSYIELGRDIDDKTKKYLDVIDACEKAGVEVPSEITDFFDELEEDGHVTDNVHWKELNEGEYQTCCNNGDVEYTIDLSKIPEGVKYIKFVNSY